MRAAGTSEDGAEERGAEEGGAVGEGPGQGLAPGRSGPDDPKRLRVAAFVSPHGFGHAARSSAVLAALHERTGATVELFTTVPRWFFEESIEGIFRYRPETVDVGFRQRSALRIDVPATVRALEVLLTPEAEPPFHSTAVSRLADDVREAGCGAVLCDIAPLGVAVSRAADLPSIVVENFRWGWLYDPWAEAFPRLRDFGAALDGWLERATVHVQARPACEPRDDLETVAPISRAPRRSRARTRAALGIPQDVPLVVVTMGGYAETLPFLDRLRANNSMRFLVTGAPRTEAGGNLHLFDNRTPLFMPDLLRASDAVVAKLGYGTVAEVWHEGIPFAWVRRPDFREMPALEAFAEAELSGWGLGPDEFGRGAWIDRLSELVALPRRRHGAGGAARVAEIIGEAAGITSQGGVKPGRGGG